MNTVQAIFQLHNSEEMVNIPISYEVEHNANRELLKCKVELSEDDLPEWLTLSYFEIPIVHVEGVISTHYSHVGNVNNKNTALLITQAGDSIRYAEAAKRRKGL